MAESQEATILPFGPVDEGRGESVSSEALREQLRMVEAILFASAEPVSEKTLLDRLPEDADLGALMGELQQAYSARGVNVVKIGGNWAFRTADDLSFLLQKEAVQTRKLTRATLEVLATIAYHQPVTRAEVEEVRGVATSKGTLDVLLESGWVKMRGRRKTPGRPVTYGTTDVFLDHFGLSELRDLPGLDELKGAGLLQSQLPANFKVPLPDDSDELQDDEDALTDDDLEDLGLLPPTGVDEDE